MTLKCCPIKAPPKLQLIDTVPIVPVQIYDYVNCSFTGCHHFTLMSSHSGKCWKR